MVFLGLKLQENRKKTGRKPEENQKKTKRKPKENQKKTKRKPKKTEENQKKRKPPPLLVVEPERASNEAQTSASAMCVDNATAMPEKRLSGVLISQEIRYLWTKHCPDIKMPPCFW